MCLMGCCLALLVSMIEWCAEVRRLTAGRFTRMSRHANRRCPAHPSLTPGPVSQRWHSMHTGT